MPDKYLEQEYIRASKDFTRTFICSLFSPFSGLVLAVIFVALTEGEQFWPFIFLITGTICCAIANPRIFIYMYNAGVFCYNIVPFVGLDLIAFLVGVIVILGLTIEFPWIFCIIFMCKRYKEKKEIKLSLEAHNIPLPEKDRSKKQLIVAFISIATAFLALFLAIIIY